MIFENQLLIEEVQNLNIDITRVAYAELDPSWYKKEHIITENMFFLVTDGEADTWCNGEHYHMTPGNVYFLPKGAQRTFQCPLFVNILYFYVNLRNGTGEELSLTPNRGIVLKDRQDTVEQMKMLFEKYDYYSAVQLRLCIERLVMEIYGTFPSNTTIDSHSPLVNAALRIITKAPHLSMTAETLAKQTLSSVSTLRKQFKKEVGIPIGKFVQEQVLIASTHDLRSPALTLSEISAKYGFCDQFYFSRLFSARYDISPSRFRKQNVI